MNYFVFFGTVVVFIDIYFANAILRALGTPNDEIWPQVSSLPDFKPSFPKWKAKPLKDLVPQLGSDGIDLLQV